MSRLVAILAFLLVAAPVRAWSGPCINEAACNDNDMCTIDTFDLSMGTPGMCVNMVDPSCADAGLPPDAGGPGPPVDAAPGAPDAATPGAVDAAVGADGSFDVGDGPLLDGCTCRAATDGRAPSMPSTLVVHVALVLLVSTRLRRTRSERKGRRP